MTALSSPSRPDRFGRIAESAHRRVSDADPALLASGLLLLTMLPAFLLLGQADARTVGAVGTWVKPAKFAASLGLHLVTLALLWGLTGGFGQRRAGRILARVIAFAALFEIAYIVFRAANGEASHYNFSSRISVVMFQLMGVGATILVLGPAVAGLAAWRSGAAADEAGRTAVVAMVVSGIMAFVTGAALSVKGGAIVGVHVAGSATWPIVGWSTTAGDLRAAHFVALHILQAVPVAAIAASVLAPRAVRTTVTVTAGVLAVLALAAMGLALSGRPLAL